MWLKCCVFLKIIPSLIMSLLDVPFRSFPPIFISPTCLDVPFRPFPLNFSSPTCSLTGPSAPSTPKTGIGRNPCATPPWGGVSGHLANQIPDAGVSNEHTPIKLPRRNRNLPHECDATVATTADLDLPRHSGASSSSKHTAAASRVSTVSKVGSSGNSLTQVLAAQDSVDSRTCNTEICADTDRETVVSTLVGSVSKVKRDRDQNVVQSLRDRQSLHRSKGNWLSKKILS